jgi:PAS domain S-box-containing protein
MPDGIRVLHVDDEPDLAALTATYLERADDRLTVETATSAAEGLDRLADGVDCVISDYDMPGTNGIELLEAVREAYPDLPFILFTGKGSEEVASEAISAGVTDYLQKESGTDQYAVLANRITNAVAQDRAEQQLERKNARLSALFELFPEPTLAYAYEDGDPIIRQVNEAFIETFGYDAEDAVGRDIDSLVVPPGRQAEAEWIDDRVKAGDAVDELLRRRTREGVRDFRFRSVPVPTEDNIDGYGIYADVTERRRREKELEEEQQRFQTLFEQLTQPLVEVEYDGLDPIVTDVNPAFEETFGYDATTIIGESLDAYIVPEDHQHEAENINEHVREGGRLVSEGVTRRTADGLGEFLLENAVYEDGSGGFAIYTDISERKRWEDALSTLHDATREFMDAQDRQTVSNRAVETARTVLDQPINGLWIYDPEEDALQPAAMTEDAAELHGDQPAYAGGESLSWRVFQEGELRVYDDIRTEPGRFTTETPIRSEIIVPLGAHGVMNISSTEPETFSELDIGLAQILGKTVEAALTRADREEELRTQRAELERQNERLEKFTSVVSHDLRNPLQLATGRVELAQNECDSPHLLDAADALERMDTLIADLLTIAGGGKRVQETDTVGLSAAAEECWTWVETEDATLTVGTDRTIRADENRLEQLLENLMLNAVEHGGDAVTVTVGDLDGGFYVADDGPGIAPDERTAVFDAGYSTADSGTGFGLSIVKEMAEAHGWEVGITAAEDGGARFEITGVEFVDQ